MIKKIITASIISAVHFLISVFSGAIGWEPQMVIVSSMSILAVFLTYKLVSQKPLASVLVVAPFYLLYSIGSVYVLSYWTYPIWIFGIIVSVVTFLLLKYRQPPVMSIPLLSLLVAIGGVIIWPNTFSYLNSKKKPEQFNLHNSKLVDVSGKEITLDELKGKVVLFDIWNSACVSCIRRFPELQKFYDDYKDDPSVRIVSLNMPLKRDRGVRPSKLTERFTFEKMYFLNEQESLKFPEFGVPLILIQDKEQRCRYAGDLSADWNIFINNARRIINRLKKES